MLEPMLEFFKTLRAANEIVAGQRVIGVAVISYTLMHVFFFGVPHFTFSTPMGRDEIGYTSVNLALVGLGLTQVYIGPKKRRKQNT